MLEHVNVTVGDPDATAAWLGRVFGWRVRWEGDGMEGAGRTVHCGTERSYLALYGPKSGAGAGPSTYGIRGGLNHLGIVVDDLDGVEGRVRAEGFAPGEQYDYEPGRRFYFEDGDGLEWEVVSYA